MANLKSKFGKRSTETSSENCGLLNDLLGPKGFVELYSIDNYRNDDVRVLLRAVDSDKNEDRICCSQQISDFLRDCSSNEELSIALDECLAYSVTASESPRTSRNGIKAILDKQGNPIIDVVFYLDEERIADDFKEIRRKAKAKLEVAKKAPRKLEWES